LIPRASSLDPNVSQQSFAASEDYIHQNYKLMRNVCLQVNFPKEKLSFVEDFPCCLLNLSPYSAFVIRVMLGTEQVLKSFQVPEKVNC
jgi:hypothetical protein